METIRNEERTNMIPIPSARPRTAAIIVGRHYRIPKLNILEYLELIDKSNA